MQVAEEVADLFQGEGVQEAGGHRGDVARFGLFDVSRLDGDLFAGGLEEDGFPFGAGGDDAAEGSAVGEPQRFRGVLRGDSLAPKTPDPGQCGVN